jgi:hypothetical protein
MRDMREESKQDPRPPMPGRDEEHIDINGNLRVPCVKDGDRAPEREGWEAWWVNVNLNPDTNGGIEKVVSYRPVNPTKEDAS